MTTDPLAAVAEDAAAALAQAQAAVAAAAVAQSGGTGRFFRAGILFVISAPSGAGKTTLCAALRQSRDFIYSVSCTTRAPRPGEVEGEDYYFLSMEEFRARVAAGEFLEHAEVHGNFYGTLRENVLRHVRAGIDVLIDIDAQGAQTIRASDDPTIRAALADVFIMPPSLDELRRRLSRRGTETPAQIEHRLVNAAVEMRRWHEYRYFILSASVEEDLQKFRSIMRAERYRSRRFREVESC
ncbi:MAG: guanylate kinase [Verrucomicrobia bacterium]|nr:guanylate kinase [Verrucomicrobiota bacterium]